MPGKIHEDKEQVAYFLFDVLFIIPLDRRSEFGGLLLELCENGIFRFPVKACLTRLFRKL